MIGEVLNCATWNVELKGIRFMWERRGRGGGGGEEGGACVWRACEGGTCNGVSLASLCWVEKFTSVNDGDFVWISEL